MRVFINKHFSGFPHHAVLDSEMIRWSQEQVECDYTFGCANSPNSLEPLMRLFGVHIPGLVPPEVRKSFEECGYHGNVPWSQVIPIRRFKSLFLEFTSKINESLLVIKGSEYPSFFCETNKLFSHLETSYINTEKCNSFLKDNESHALKSLLDIAINESLPVPVYDRVSTKTGRLTIKAGPQILTLKKEYRHVFRPSSPSKKLYEVDFVSLEPRVALCIAGKDVAGDVYTTFSTQSGLGVSRDVAKLAVLCALYGAGKYRLESVLSKDASSVSAASLLSAVKKFFAIGNLSKSLIHEARSGLICNMFGRPVEVDDSRDTVLVNNFLQSSATDIAILGFLRFVESLQEHVSPLFIIHDALVFEADPKHLAPITEYVDNGFSLKGVGDFPLKITEFSP
tara:strand:- start:125 stop:1312 length:1188 start_codon:yes stop_codon:yes gene_type:complete